MEKYQPLFNYKSSPKPGAFLYGRHDIMILNPDPIIYYQQKTAYTTFLLFSWNISNGNEWFPLGGVIDLVIIRLK